MTRVRITNEALDDLNEGFLFYETQGPGLGDYFVSSLRADVERLKISAGAHRIVHRDYFHVVSRVFPFGIYYTWSDGIAAVWAVIDLRRDPAWILDQIEGR